MREYETIISHLIVDREYAEKYLPHINPSDYDFPESNLFSIIKNYYEKFPAAKNVPKDVLQVEIEDFHLDSERFNHIKQVIDELPRSNGVDRGWLNEITENNIREAKCFTVLHQVLPENKKHDFDKIKVYFRKGLDVCEETFTPEKINRNIIEMMKNFSPPIYLIERLFKRGYLYSMTEVTGSGKTAAALALAKTVATGASLGDRIVSKGRVHYFAGENPYDVLHRCMAMFEGAHAIDITICPLAGREAAERSLNELIKDNEPVALVIVDTSTAYFDGDEENSNKQALDHAKWLRSITTRVPGNPTVLVCSHPSLASKHTGDFVPRGGSAFLNEVDGNLECIKVGDISLLKRHENKYRDVLFPPIAFLREVRYVEDMATIIASFVSEEEATVAETKNSSEEMDVLRLLPLPVRKLAGKLGWNKSKAERMMKKLRHKKLIDESNELTSLALELIGENNPKKPF